MTKNALQPLAPGPLRRTVRRLVPFALRAGARRVPHVTRWLRDRPEVERAPAGGLLLCERSSPLRRPSTTYEEDLQRAKEANVRRVATALNEVRLAPGQRLSWHGVVGPPLRMRGFAAGPELHDGRLARGAGGGACQVANLLFWLGAHAGLELVERHRHGMDLFPDHARTVPFGCGATVFYPNHDLVFDNPHGTGIRWAFTVDATHLHGRVYAEEDLEATWSLHEVAHRFERRDGDVWRSNQIVRRRTTALGEVDRPFVDNVARVMYPVPSHLLES